MDLNSSPKCHWKLIRTSGRDHLSKVSAVRENSSTAKDREHHVYNEDAENEFYFQISLFHGAAIS